MYLFTNIIDVFPFPVTALFHSSFCHCILHFVLFVNSGSFSFMVASTRVLF
jgi:hypothetical protein